MFKFAEILKQLPECFGALQQLTVLPVISLLTYKVKYSMPFTLEKHSCINIYLMWKCWGYERRHRYWWDKNCLNFHEFTSSLVFGACPHSNWHVAVLVVKNFMNYARKTTYHVSHYNHIVLCNFRPAILEKDNTSDSSILITAQPRLSWGITLFLTSPKHKISPLKQHQWKPLDYSGSLCIFIILTY